MHIIHTVLNYNNELVYISYNFTYHGSIATSSELTYRKL
jgi:hypothetical protein